MPAANDSWWKRPDLWVEVFVILNLGFLTFDIYLAHSENQFRSRAEYIPLFFSAIAPVVLILALIERARPAAQKENRWRGRWLRPAPIPRGRKIHWRRDRPG